MSVVGDGENLLYYPTHEEQHHELRQELDDLDIPFDRNTLNHQATLESIANFTSSTWWLKRFWGWAEISQKFTPKHKLPPTYTHSDIHHKISLPTALNVNYNKSRKMLNNTRCLRLQHPLYLFPVGLGLYNVKKNVK